MISDRSFLPRPFEIIGSLSPERRQAYFERNAARFPAGGWLVEHRSDTAHGQGHMLDFVRASRPTGRRFESADWIVSRMGPVTVPSGVTPSPAMR